MVDEADILDPATRAALTQKLADCEAKTSDQLVVVTLRSLQGTSIEDFGVELGRRWRIGQTGTNNGVLLIVVPSERKVRIEVGYGLEGMLTDAVSKLIIENAIIPRFRANDIPGGVSRGVDDAPPIMKKIKRTSAMTKIQATTGPQSGAASGRFAARAFHSSASPVSTLMMSSTPRLMPPAKSLARKRGMMAFSMMSREIASVSVPSRP